MTAHPAWQYRSAVPGVVWPAIPGEEAAAQLALHFQLQQTQWLSPERLLELQFRQLDVLLRHAWETVPYYRDRWTGAYDPAVALTAERFAKLPFLTRAEVQAHGGQLYSTRPPAAHGAVREGQTSGSTGRPIAFRGTNLTELYWRAFNLRDHVWHQRDLGGKLAVVRVILASSAEPPHGVVMDGWGAVTDAAFLTGPAAAMSIRASLDEQLAWLQRHDPHYFLTYPSNLTALARHSLKQGVRLPRLRQVRTISEIVAPELRNLCREAWGVPLVDVYSAMELGYLALECPQERCYHVQSENALVEIVDGEGRPCRPGEVGRVVVTSLHNFAGPLVRYELGDYAEAGGACPCGRGLPVLTRILGRQRNMLALPSGEKHWPLVGYLSEAPVRQFQVVQKSLERIEVRVVPLHPFTPAEEDGIRTLLVEKAFRHPFEIDIVYLDEISRSPSGKFEEFVSEVA
jgi:phenylacetate-CoA ligase